METIVMTQELLDKWIEAIPTYTKGAENLKRDIYGEDDHYGDEEPIAVGFCCLGVLADILNPEGWNSPEGPVYEWNGADCYLTVDSSEEFTLIQGLPTEVQRELAKINDSSDSWEPVIEKIKELVIL